MNDPNEVVEAAYYPVFCQNYPVFCQSYLVFCQSYPVFCQSYPVFCQNYPVLWKSYPVFCAVIFFVSVARSKHDLNTCQPEIPIRVTSGIKDLLNNSNQITVGALKICTISIVFAPRNWNQITVGARVLNIYGFHYQSVFLNWAKNYKITFSKHYSAYMLTL